MATMLQNDDSSQKHIEVVRRHQRRCRRTKGAAEFAAAIEPARANLKEKLDGRLKLIEMEQDARDDLELADGDLDDCVITVSDRAKEIDRDQPGQNLHAKLFPSGRTTDFTEADILVEPNETDKIAVAIDSLGKEHALAPLAARLRSLGDAGRNAAKAVGDAIRARKVGEADEELAQAELRKAYEMNYVNARGKLGRRLAERLFPRIGRRPPGGEGGGGPGTGGGGPA